MLSSFTRASTALVIRHVPRSDPPSFQIVRLSDGKVSEAMPSPSPFNFSVEGRPQSHLMQELQWYLEDFLEFPFPPETDRADRVVAALKRWGEQTFKALFGSPLATRMFQEAVSEGYSRLNLRIVSDHPGVLAWPWETLRDPDMG